MLSTIIMILIAGVLLLFWILTYNSLIKMKNWVEESWAQIDVQLKRRYDLIPNLVEIVKGYAQHEQETLQKVIEARNNIVTGGNIDRAAQLYASDQLTGALGNLFALSEDYPDLKANENFLMLQEEITGTENKIAYSRQLYNSTVMKYNTRIQTIPNNIIASVHNFKNIEMLEAKVEERENVKVSM